MINCGIWLESATCACSTLKRGTVPGFKPVLLILQLALQKLYRFFLHADQRAIELHKVKLLPNGGDDHIDRVAKCVVAAVALKIGRADLRNDPAAGENNLGYLQLHTVTALDVAET